MLTVRLVAVLDLSDLSCRKAVVDGVWYRIVRTWPDWEVRRANARALVIGGWHFWSCPELGWCRGYRRVMKAIWAALKRMEAETGRSMYKLLT